MAQPANADFRTLLDYDATLYDDARRFEVVTLDFVHFAAMAESIGLFLDLGVGAIAAHLRALGDRALACVDTHPAVVLVTPRDAGSRAGVFAFRVRDTDATVERLKAANVFHSVREGCVRFSPHCYTTVEEFDRALSLLDG